MHSRSNDSLPIETNSRPRASHVLPGMAMSLALIAVGAAWGQDFSLAPSGSWEVVPSPNGGPQPEGNTLLATVALSSTDAWAVGAEPNPSPFLTATLALHWDGSGWSIVDTPPISAPTVQLNSASAVDSSNVWAAGYSDNPSCLCGQTVVEHWDGISWTRVSSPNPGVADYLYGIAALSATDLWVVGYEWISPSAWIPLILHYDGKSWSAFDESQFQFGILSSVFAMATDDVWAVGWVGLIPNIQALAVHWNGTSWTQVTFPTEPGGWILLRSVSGVAADDVWAVGTYNFDDFFGNRDSRPRSYHWDGSTWNNVLLPLGGRSSRLTAVNANATDDVWAVGAGEVEFPTYSYVTFHWDGSRWSNVPNPNQGILYAVSASSRSDVWAVGAGFITYGTHTIHYTVP